MPPKDKVYLAVSIDVEEEGLFSGVYERHPKIVNAPHLVRMFPLLDRGVKPTLFCASSALADPRARATIDKLRKRSALEIGAHLHHWNTPPLDPDGEETLRSVPASEISDEAFERKLRTLLREAEIFGGEKIESFRMGRWDLDPRRFSILAANGIRVDSSIRPLHGSPSAPPDHFFAPRDPFRVKLGEKEIFEVPRTAVPIHPDLERVPPFMRSGLKNWGVLSLLPVEHPLWLMKITAKAHISRGNKTLSLTWHSSEMMPGGSPRLRSEEEVNNFIKKISAWTDWLEDNYDVKSLTMSELRRELGSTAPLVSADGDWKRIEPD
ncbi:MAG: glycosyl transferase family 1 [Desulfovibrio sp.]|nr:glycosyl transferase family 1 [Desulfovibrio sp.]